MKQTLRLLPIFIILFLLVYLLFTAFAFIHEWLMTAPHHPGEAFRVTVSVLPLILLRVLPASVAFSLFGLLFFRRSHRSNSFFGSLLVLILAVAVYGGLFYYLSGLETPDIQQERSAFPPLRERQMQRIGDTMLYVEEQLPVAREGREEFGVYSLNTVLAVSLEDPAAPYMQLYPKGAAYPGERRIVLGDGAAALRYGELDAPGLGNLQPPRLLSGMFQEIEGMVRHLRSLLERSLVFFGIALFAQVLWAISAWGLVRISSWPMFNALLALLAFRGIFFLWETFRSDIVLDTVAPVVPEQFLPLVPAGVFVLIAVLMLAWSSLVRPKGEAG